MTQEETKPSDTPEDAPIPAEKPLESQPESLTETVQINRGLLKRSGKTRSSYYEPT